MKVVIVESPAKAKTINKYLGSDYKVLASYGHIRDLPSKDGSVDPESDFSMIWEMDANGAKRVKEIAEAVKGNESLILATDPDREGEAISWHILEALKKKNRLKSLDIERVVFNAITKKAVEEAMRNPRDIDQELVDAYLARRALDYLVGFNLSPVLWRKLPGSRSAGRVQSVALRLICRREIEIERFIPIEYWSVTAHLSTPSGDTFEASLIEFEGEKLKKHSIGNEQQAQKALEAVRAGNYQIAELETKPVKRNPPPPFVTSTLQQDASRRLGFSAKQTMQVAQKLYEAGHITYMRTDGVQMAEEAYHAARDMIGARFGKRYLPDGPRRYTSKAKNTQEAHEAIRPTDFTNAPEDFNGEAEQKRLYTLIWRRAVASQMEPARFERTTATIASHSGQCVLRATGSVLQFDGFLTLYNEGRDDGDSEEQDKRLPKLTKGEASRLQDAKAEQHFTEPPPRFTEASLVKRMEELGIGRPSTYASIISVLQDRDYVRLDKKRFFPEDKGRLVTAFLECFFGRYVEYDFTADLEERLDLISDGKLGWKALLREFWEQFQADIGETKDLRTTAVLDALNEVLGPHIFPPDPDKPDANPRLCPLCNVGSLSLKLGRYGAFVGCSNYPECKFTRPFASDGAEGSATLSSEANILGLDPETQMEVSLRSGRFGPYIQLGEAVGKGDKPKRASLPKDWSPDSITLERALDLLSLPREVGSHPEDGQMILAGIGRYGPYVQHGRTYANIGSTAEVFEIGLNRAVSAIADKQASRGQGRSTAKVLKELGEHPDDGGVIQILDGRYGPYVKYGKINATLPKGHPPEAVELSLALELINAKQASKGKSKAKPKRKATAKTKASKS